MVILLCEFEKVYQSAYTNSLVVGKMSTSILGQSLGT